MLNELSLLSGLNLLNILSSQMHAQKSFSALAVLQRICNISNAYLVKWQVQFLRYRGGNRCAQTIVFSLHVHISGARSPKSLQKDSGLLHICFLCIQMQWKWSRECWAIRASHIVAVQKSEPVALWIKRSKNLYFTCFVASEA